MKLKNDHRGFSLIEMVIVLGVIAIITTTSLTVLRNVRVANSEKAVRIYSTALSKLQANTMGKAEKQFLYIYLYNGDYYITTSTVNVYDDSVLNGSGTPLGSGIKVYMSLDGINYSQLSRAAVSFKKDGSFDVNSVEYLGIRNGNEKIMHVIKLNKETGRHFIDEIEVVD